MFITSHYASYCCHCLRVLEIIFINKNAETLYDDIRKFPFLDMTPVVEYKHVLFLMSSIDQIKVQLDSQKKKKKHKKHALV